MAPTTTTLSLLNETQVRRVDEAIGEAEKNTSGEIIAVLASRSQVYWHAPYEAGLFGAGLAILIATVGWLVWKQEGFPYWHIGIYCGITVGGFLAGFFATRVDRIERFFAGGAIMKAEVEERAHRLFVQHGVFGTVGRTGVLLYVSLFEHMVIVLGDTTISAKLGPAEYEEVVKVVITRVKVGKLQEGLIEGIQLLGVHLGAHFPRAADDKDELPNRLYVMP